VIDAILPAAVSAVEAWRDLTDVTLFPEEEAAIGRAVGKRRREFISARGCARKALAGLGYEPGPIGSGERGEPIWPAGVVGGITHCTGYRACAVARSDEIATIGIDAEPHAALPDRLLPRIARAEELPAMRRLDSEQPQVHWDRLLFSAKESVFKAWFPLAERSLGFEDSIVEFDRVGRSFEAKLLVPGPVVEGSALGGFSGRWAVGRGIVATAIAVSRADRSLGRARKALVGIDRLPRTP
jgi:4'-phosphopantetheinyl transferase EntD